MSYKAQKITRDRKGRTGFKMDMGDGAEYSCTVIKYDSWCVTLDGEWICDARTKKDAERIAKAMNEAAKPAPQDEIESTVTHNGMTLVGEFMTQSGDNTLNDLMVCCRGNISKAARVLGINRRTIYDTISLKTPNIIRDGVMYKPCARDYS